MVLLPTTDDELRVRLRTRGINPTPQRMLLARLLLTNRVHVSAETAFRLANSGTTHVSKATVYNTLDLFAAKGLIARVVIGPQSTIYDSNTEFHHHLYNESTGELTDVEAGEIEFAGLPDLPEGTKLKGVDIVVRVIRKV